MPAMSSVGHRAYARTKKVNRNVWVDRNALALSHLAGNRGDTGRSRWNINEIFICRPTASIVLIVAAGIALRESEMTMWDVMYPRKRTLTDYLMDSFPAFRDLAVNTRPESIVLRF
ncbi:hypothetical protein Trydic_g15743 [Trypoxylus dichotomus]